MKNHKTITKNAEAEYEIQKSRFIAHTARISSEEEAQAFILSMKKKYFDARHNCSAWVLGENSEKQKSNDDGEPGGTAGNPILETIKKNGLTDTVIVVTRYFGGIKLGAGGLIRAYSHTAALGIEASGISAIRLFSRIKVTIDYSLLGTLENHLRLQEIRVADKEYTDKVALTLLLELERSESQQAVIVDLLAGKCQLEDLGNEYVELPEDTGVIDE